jgi:LPXTG-site transpeptidase (sortase) family protein
VNYVGWSLTPFAYLSNLNVGDSVYVTMADGTMYTYTVNSVTLVPVAAVDMFQVLYPALDNNTEQVTLMTCGGDFFYQPGVGGEYGSRLIATATRFIP